MPAPVVDKATLRIVDGWHRVRAGKRALGAEGSIQVDVRTFKNGRDLIRAAVDANVTHGRRLDKIDRVRCAVLLREAGLSSVQIAVTLRIREPVLEKLVLQIAPVPLGANGGVVPGTNQLPLKRLAAHLAGQMLTEEQSAAHRSMPGTSLTLLARQLTGAIQAGLVDPDNERLREALLELHVALGEYLNKT